MVLISFISALIISLGFSDTEFKDKLVGAWKMEANGQTSLMIVTDNHYSIATYRENPAKFLSTSGGKWQRNDGGVVYIEEYNTSDQSNLGEDQSIDILLSGNNLKTGDQSWDRVDNGTPGKLSGAWLITGRKRNGEISTSTPGVRRTMKILSGKHFQWIAYNTETGQFFGTGGGTYTTKNGKYVENIEFFSRDNTRVGASLDFDYKIKEEGWHHSGFSSKGDPLYEIWTKRSDLGI